MTLKWNCSKEIPLFICNYAAFWGHSRRHHDFTSLSSTGQPQASHTASPCGGCLAALLGTGKVPSTPLEGQGGSLAPRNKEPSQDLLHEERLSHHQTLNTPQTRPAASTPWQMESLTGHCTTRATASSHIPLKDCQHHILVHLCTKSLMDLHAHILFILFCSISTLDSSHTIYLDRECDG